MTPSRKKSSSGILALVVVIAVTIGAIYKFTPLLVSDDSKGSNSLDTNDLGVSPQIAGADNGNVANNEPVSAHSDTAFVPKEAGISESTSTKFSVRFSNIQGSLEQLLAREAAGDMSASYELAARTLDCLLGVAAHMCESYMLGVDEGEERIERSASAGIVAAQINYLSNIELFNPTDGSEEMTLERATKFMVHLQNARDAGSADAIYLLGLMASTGADGGARMDVEQSLTGLSRLEAIAYQMASAEIYSGIKDQPRILAFVDDEIARLSPREVDEVARMKNDLLERPGCCFVTRREKSD